LTIPKLFSMKQLTLVVLISIFCSFVPQKKTKVIFFGDSITELGVKPGGYVTRVDSMAKLKGKGSDFDFLGAGVSGNKVYDLYLRMEEDVLSKSPDIVVIYVGVNDVWHKTLLGTGTDADKFEKFYLAILKKFKERNIKAILCTPAVVGEKTDASNQLDGDLNRYSNIIRDIAKNSKLPLIDLRQQFTDYDRAHNPQNLEKNILTYDKVHLNDIGNQLVADLMWNAIQKAANN
jgi:lysophospholipase L1-like esterase